MVIINVYLKKKKFLYVNYRLTFKETPQLEHIQIDNKCSLKWCLRFLSNEEGDALFKHVLQESNFVYTEMNMIGKVVKLVRRYKTKEIVFILFLCIY